MEYMFKAGFLGTKAPIFMDIVTLIVGLLPALIYIAIIFAKRQQYKLHIALQLFLYFFAVIVVSYFEYGVRVGGGFDNYVKGSSMPHDFLFGFLLFHIAISLITMIWWSMTIIFGLKEFNRDNLPGKSSKSHSKLGRQSAIGIFFTSLTGIWVYLFLFVY